MTFNRTRARTVLLILAPVFASAVAGWNLHGTIWITLNYAFLDNVLRFNVKQGAVEKSPRIVYVTITDDIYRQAQSAVLDRSVPAKITSILSGFGAAAVGYDILLPYTADQPSDELLVRAVKESRSTHMPVAFGLSLEPCGRDGTGHWMSHLGRPQTIGTPPALGVCHSVPPFRAITHAAARLGHVSATADSDGVYRHQLLMVRSGDLFMPSLALAMFLTDAGCRFEDVEIRWGRHLRIPADKSKTLKADVVVPIDEDGSTFIPYVDLWNRDFQQVKATTLIQSAGNEDLRGNFTDMLGNALVFIGDVSTGASDVGSTPLELRVPKVSMHAAVLNGLLTNGFYSRITSGEFGLIILIGFIALGSAACSQRRWIMHAAAGAILIGIAGVTLVRFGQHVIWPVASLGITIALAHAVLAVGIEILDRREQAARLLESNFALTAIKDNLELLVGSRTDELKKALGESDRLLLNILPEKIVRELKEKGTTRPVLFESVTVLFTDFHGFTKIAETMSPEELIEQLDKCFSYFDAVSRKYQLEKIKTIGDAYLIVGGIPTPNRTHAVDSVLAAMEIQSFMNQMKLIREMENQPYWELRLGIHSGPVIAGVIGELKFCYDVFGDTVNTASRMESSGVTGKINVSGATHALIKDFFACEYRGKVSAKNKGDVDMYFVESILPELSREGDGRVPSPLFAEKLAALRDDVREGP